MPFVVQQAAALTLVLVVAAAVGTAVAGARAPLAFRSILGLAVAGQTMAVLATMGALRPWTLCALAAVALAGGAARSTRFAVNWRSAIGVAMVTAPLFVLALYPPVAFDETLYHLPFVRAIANSGAIRFLPNLRLPVFPQLHELLCVPGFLMFGDVATHMVAVAELLLLAALLVDWPQQRKAGFLAAALLLGNPIAIQLGTVTHVESALTLFIAAGFYCLDRPPGLHRRFYIAAAGFLFGTACSVKYLGWYFAVGAVVFLLWTDSEHWRTIPTFLLTFVVAVLPMYGSIVALAGSPLFPFVPTLFGATPWTIALSDRAASTVNLLRLFWDITFARERVNQQPPYSPLFAVALMITVIAAYRDRRAAFLSALCAGYLCIFVFLPQDSRYLLPLLPLVSVAAACVVARWERLTFSLSILSIAAGLAYAGYRIARQGPPPVNVAQRRQYLEQRIPEYRALERRGPGRIYVCGAEQLTYYGGDDLLGDVIGPMANARIVGGSHDSAELSTALTRLRIRTLLMSRSACPKEWQRLPAAPAFERIYADAGAVLWRVRSQSPTDSR